MTTSISIRRIISRFHPRTYSSQAATNPNPSTSSSLNPAFNRLTTSRGLVPTQIWGKTSEQLHNRRCHPLNTLHREINNYFLQTHPDLFNTYSNLSPVVTTTQCFDDLLVPPEHPSRAASDTYYIDNNTLLRPHMTAHDVPLLRDGHTAFLLCGDVYRRDTVDRTHYPVFHQMDGVRLFDVDTPREDIVNDLQAVLTGLARHLFGSEAELRWVPGYFPFTSPSFELEVRWSGEWLELLGCGLLARGVLGRGNIREDINGWAFGLGLERLAMVLFDIPDIRLFWSTDERVTSQFKDGSLKERYKPFSIFPSVEKDVSFWIDDESQFHENDVHEIVRACGGDIVENVQVVDRFEKKGKKSLCFRVTFRSMERSLTHSETNEIYDQLREKLSIDLPVTLR